MLTQLARVRPSRSSIEDDLAAEADGLRLLVARQLPGVAELQPVVVLLDLAAAVDLLLEHPEVVADAVPDGRQLQRRQRVHEAGRQAPEAAVAETGIPLALEDLPELEPVVGRHLHRRVVEAHVHETEAEAAAGQELRREVADPFDVLLDVRPLGGQPAVDQAIANRVREGVVEIERGGVPQLLGAGVHDMVEHRGPKVGCQQAGAAARRGPAAGIGFFLATRLNSNGHRRSFHHMGVVVRVSVLSGFDERRRALPRGVKNRTALTER